MAAILQDKAKVIMKYGLAQLPAALLLSMGV
jgi:hypothetical protein